MKYKHCAALACAAISLAGVANAKPLTNGAAIPAIETPEPPPPAPGVELVCFPHARPGERNPARSINISAWFDQDAMPGLSVVWFMADGTPYDRSTQYFNTKVWKPTKVPEIFWSGLHTTNPAESIIGKLMIGADGQWQYAEAHFRRGVQVGGIDRSPCAPQDTRQAIE